ncbi:MAG TPA: hypothetical protein VIO36_08330 [Anaerolineaceae bacterium]
MRAELDLVAEFHRVYRCYLQEQPVGAIPEREWLVRARLIQEELDEYRAAAQAGDLVGVADALSDLLYVVLGTYLAHGLQGAAEDLFREVHASNMSKLDANGEPIYREDGKVLKSELFRAPDLRAILDRVKSE